MSKQKKIQDDLSAYLDGELSSGRAEQVHRALADDADLSAELEDIRAVRNLLAALPRARAPRGLADSVLQQAERASLVNTPPGQADRRALRWMPYAAAAAILVAAATLGMMLYSELWPTDVPPGTYDKLVRNNADDAGESPTGPGSGRHGKDGGGVQIASNDLNGRSLGGNSNGHGNGTDPKGGRRGGIVRLGNLPEAEINEVIYTPTVAHTQKQIETFLTRNAIEPVVTTTSTTPVIGRQSTDIRGRGNYYHAYRVTADQVRIRIDAATPEQIERIRGEIDKIRMEQRVSQVTIPGEVIALHRIPIPKPAAPYGKHRPRVTKSGPTPEPAGDQASAKPAADGGEGIAKGDTRIGGGTGGRDSPGTGKVQQDDESTGEAIRGKLGKRPAPVRPKDRRQVAGGQSPAGRAPARTPPKKTDEERNGRKIEGKGEPDRTDPSTTTPGGTIARKETRPPKNGDATTTSVSGQQQTVDNVQALVQKHKDYKAPAERHDHDATGFKSVLNKLLELNLPEGWSTDKSIPGVASKPASRPSKATTRSALADRGTNQQDGTAQPALQGGAAGYATTRDASQFRFGQGKGILSRLAGANVQALIITLNFRAVTDSTSRQQIDASKKDATTSQKNNSK